MVSLSVSTRRTMSSSIALVALVASTLSVGVSTTSAAVGSAAAPVEAELTVGSFVGGRSETTGLFCARDGELPAVRKTLPGTGQVVTGRSSSRQTVDGGGDDVATFDVSSSSRARLAVRKRVIRSFTLTTRASVAGTIALGAESDCDTEARAFGFVDAEASYPPGFLTVRLVVTGGAEGEFQVQRSTLDGFSVYANSPTRTTSTAFVGGGSGDPYSFRLYGVARVNRPTSGSGPTSASASGTVTVTGSFVGIGEATTGAKGTGRRFVRLPPRRSCASNTIRAKVASRARAAAIRTVVFTVNGKRAGRLTTPRAGRALTLRRPAPGQSARVRATVTRKNGAKRVVTRSYAACRG